MARGLVSIMEVNCSSYCCICLSMVFMTLCKAWPGLLDFKKVFGSLWDLAKLVVLVLEIFMPLGDTTRKTTILFPETEGILISPCHGNHIYLLPVSILFWLSSGTQRLVRNLAQPRCCLFDGSSNVE